MNVAMHEYAKELPEIYREILATFPRVEPTRRVGYGLAYQTIYESMGRLRSLGEIIEACEKMRDAGVVEIKHRIFVHPKPLGEDIITAVTGKEAPVQMVPAFPDPPAQ